MNIDVNDLTAMFNQYTLAQKKLFLDWMELPVQNNEEAKNRFIESLKDPAVNSEEVNDQEMSERFDSFIGRIQNFNANPENNNQITSICESMAASNMESCKTKCNSSKPANLQKCLDDCESQHQIEIQNCSSSNHARYYPKHLKS